MNAQPRSRTDPRAEATREALIEAAEAMFAQAGVDGVSLRQIGAAIGAANTNVVAYHFGSKDALALAIFRRRLPAIDARRGELLALADKAGRGKNLGALLDVLCRPLLEQTNREGRRSYAAFLEGVSRSNRLSLRAALMGEFETSNAVIARVAGASGGKLNQAFVARLQISMAMFFSTIQLIDQSGCGPARAESLFVDTLKMMEAALLASKPKKKGREKP